MAARVRRHGPRELPSHGGRGGAAGATLQAESVDTGSDPDRDPHLLNGGLDFQGRLLPLLVPEIPRPEASLVISASCARSCISRCSRQAEQSPPSRPGSPAIAQRATEGLGQAPAGVHGQRAPSALKLTTTHNRTAPAGTLRGAAKAQEAR